MASFAYDLAARHAEVHNARSGDVNLYRWDTDRSSRGVTDPFGYTVSRSHNRDGRLEGYASRRGATVNRAFDDDQRLVGRWDHFGAGDTYAYDDEGRIISATDPAGHTTVYV